MKRIAAVLVLLFIGCVVVIGCGGSTSSSPTSNSSEDNSTVSKPETYTVTDSTIRQDYTTYMQTIWHLRGQIIDGVAGSANELQTYVDGNQSKIESYQPTESDLVTAKGYIDQLGNKALALVSSQDTSTQRGFNDTVQAICGTLHVASGE
jgi:hypothetical protein